MPPWNLAIHSWLSAPLQPFTPIMAGAVRRLWEDSR